MKIYMVYVKKYVPYEVDESIDIKPFLFKHKAKGLVAELEFLQEQFEEDSQNQSLRNHEFFDYFYDECGTFHYKEYEVDENK